MVDAESFVAEARSQEPAPVLAAVPKNDVVVTTDSGRELREMTVYLPVELARKMSMHCVEKDRDVSNLVAEAVQAQLAPKPQPAPVRVAVKPTIAERATALGRMLRARLAM